jgi:uncharacterized membrane protein required for colicin V production
MLYPYVTGVFTSFMEYGEWLDRAVFAAIFLVISSSINTMTRGFVNMLSPAGRIGKLGRIFGALFGGVQGLLYLACGLILASALLDDESSMKKNIDEGIISSRIQQTISVSYGTMDKIIRKTGLNPFLEKVETEVQEQIDNAETKVQQELQQRMDQLL